MGPDSINNRVLRELATELSVPLCSLFNQSIQTGIFPECWKFANVCPIHKNGDRSVPSNYRPVFLLCTTDKVFERVIFKHLYNHFLDNKILTPLQSGFIPGESSVDQLTYLYDTFCQALDSGKEVRVIFCDISKAFDRVWHKGLFKVKLEAAGISGNLLSWFASYLANRRQRWFFPVLIHGGTLFMQVFPRAKYWGRFYSYSLSMMSLKTLDLVFVFLQMTLVCT